jgi:hypothetical protein
VKRKKKKRREEKKRRWKRKKERTDILSLSLLAFLICFFSCLSLSPSFSSLLFSLSASEGNQTTFFCFFFSHSQQQRNNNSNSDSNGFSGDAAVVIRKETN